MPRIGATGRLLLGVTAAALLAIVLGVAIAYVLTRGQSPPALAPLSNPVQPTSRIVPSTIARIALVDQRGRPTDLAKFHGRYVILADFMTSCQEACPITTGALLIVQRALAAAHLTGKVMVVEVSVDAARDTPSRFRAYERHFGVPWTLLTGTAPQLNRFWSWFGAYYHRVPEASPADLNWETGKPYTYDLVHSDDVFVLGPSGNEAAIVSGNANVRGHLPKDLASLLNDQGRINLAHPGFGSWTPADLLQELGSVVGRAIPLPG